MRSSLAASLWSGGKPGEWRGIGGKFADKTIGTLLFGTVAGGLGAELSGGNFWQGAATGLIVSGLNHVVHHLQEKVQKYLDHREFLRWYKKTIDNIDQNIQILEEMGNILGGVSIGEGLIQTLKGIKFTPLLAIGTAQSFNAKNLSNLKDQLILMKSDYDMQHDYLDFSVGKDTKYGITIQSLHISVPAHGGIGQNIYRIIDNYTKQTILHTSTTFNF